MMECRIGTVAESIIQLREEDSSNSSTRDQQPDDEPVQISSSSNMIRTTEFHGPDDDGVERIVPTLTRRFVFRRNRVSPVCSNEAARESSPRTAVVVEDVETDAGGSLVSQTATTQARAESHLGNQPLLRPHQLQGLQQSKLPLKERLRQRRQAMQYLDEVTQDGKSSRAASKGCCENWRYIKWPKQKSKIRRYFSYELWRGHLIHVESRFGSSVVSYFVFLRWLFYMNIVIFMLWFGVICIPQIVLYSYQGLNRSSHAACVYQSNQGGDIKCSSNYSSQVVYKVIDFANVSDCWQKEIRFTIRECLIDENYIAYKEGTDEVTVSPKKCIQGDTPHMLCSNVDPHIEWYEYILDFATGGGIYNQTMLFHGGYVYNSSMLPFQFDLAFLIMVGVVYIFSIILLVFKMGRAYGESYIRFTGREQIQLSSKLFTAWDFNITDKKTSEQRKTSISTDFQEEHADAKAREKKLSWKFYVLVWFIRFWTNLLVLILLVGAAAAIYYSADFEYQTLPEIEDNIILFTVVGFLTSAVISVLNVVYPYLFDVIAKLEQYKVASTRISMTLIRTILVRLSSLLVLLGSLYNVISNCTVAAEADNAGDICTLNKITQNILSNHTNDTATCPECWETYIGQQFFKLAILNFIIALGATVFIETGRNILSKQFISHVINKIKNKKLKKYLSIIMRRGYFDIPRSILDLIYTQTLMWLGFLFSPLLPLITLCTSFCLFYVKKYSLMYNLDPDKKSLSKSAKTNFLFLFLMLLALFASIIPVLFAVTQLRPSEHCGPFRGLNTMYQSITDLVGRWPCSLQVAIDFLTSAAFVVPLITFLLLVLYAMYVILKTRKYHHKIMKKQILDRTVRHVQMNY